MIVPRLNLGLHGPHVAAPIRSWQVHEGFYASGGLWPSVYRVRCFRRKSGHGVGQLLNQSFEQHFLCFDGKFPLEKETCGCELLKDLFLKWKCSVLVEESSGWKSWGVNGLLVRKDAF